MFFVDLFTKIIYQPFLNILVFFYWLLGLFAQHGAKPDMGIAVILLTIVIRIILLPLNLAEDKSEKDRREMERLIHETEALYRADPIRQRQEVKKLFHRNRGVVIGELVSFFIQVAISLMLWRIFAEGLTGQDLHLIYPFMPHVDTPFNLVFLGKFDLTRSNWVLNLIQSIMIFLVETTSILTSPYPPMKGEVVRLQLVLPVVSFLVFMFLPAGKKLFIITTLIISLILLIFKFFRRKIREYAQEKVDKELAAVQTQQAPPSPTPSVVPGPLPVLPGEKIVQVKQ